jgi:HAD superfamily hydrolase (TIGR01509 family)
MPSAERIDVVTVDAFGTLVELLEPYGRLRDALASREVERSADEIAAAFAAEAAYYLEHSDRGRDAESLTRLRRECAAVFLRELSVDLDPEEFAPAYVDALRFRPLHGAEPALQQLRSAGLTLCCVSNWDISLSHQLAALGLARFFVTVVTSAEAGAPKPDPRPFRVALRRAGVPPDRALHIGDSGSDRAGAAAAGLAFEPAPLATLPTRLGL